MPLLVLCVIYGAVILALVWLLRRLHVSTARAILASLLIFGMAAGILAALRWPDDSSVLVNFPAVWLGDWLYVRAISSIGDPGSPQAHYTIPWLLRVPQVYMVTSFGAYALLGFALQWIYQIGWGRTSS